MKKWLWSDEGIYSFLAKADQTAVALTCYAAQREHFERITDDATTLPPRQDNGESIVRHA